MCPCTCMASTSLSCPPSRCTVEYGIFRLRFSKNGKNCKNRNVTYCAAYWAESLFSHVLSHYHQRNIPLKTHTDT